MKHWEDGTFLKVPFHVDDSIICSKGAKRFAWYEKELGKRFKYTMGPLTYSLGVRYSINYEDKIIKMDQMEQANKLLAQFQMDNCIPAPYPMPNSQAPTREDIPEDDAEQEELRKSFDMHSCAGGINWLASGVFPGVAKALKYLSANVNAFGKTHIALAKHLLRYIRGQRDVGLTFQGGFPRTLQIFTDANHANCPDTRRSMSGIIIKFGGNTIMWRSAWQNIVSHSSTESELMALDKGATLGQYIKHLLGEMGFSIIGPISIFVDNQAAIDLSSNPIKTGRNLHMHARYFYIRDMVYHEEYVLIQIPTTEQISDVLVTYKGGPVFQKLYARIIDCAYVFFDANENPIWDNSLLGRMPSERPPSSR